MLAVIFEGNHTCLMLLIIGMELQRTSRYVLLRERQWFGFCRQPSSLQMQYILCSGVYEFVKVPKLVIMIR